jgi:hypothetical protein
MGPIEMAILITGAAFFGAVLGRFCKVLVLLPAGALAIALLLGRGEVAGHTFCNSFLGIGLLFTSLELGYVTGLISTDISTAVQGFRGFLARSRRPASSRRPTKVNRLCLGRCFAPGAFVERLAQAARDASARSEPIE